MSLCPCGSNIEYEQCCGPLLSGGRKAETAEALMRSRYSAFVEGAFDYLGESLHPAHRADHDVAATRRWAESADWLGLEILATDGGKPGDDEGMVEFVATYKDKGVLRKHHERSRFRREADRWYFLDGEVVPARTQIREGPRVGRNAPCPCGSGRKYKKCCGR